MSDKNKLCRFWAKAAIIGASTVAGFAIIIKFIKKNKSNMNQFQITDTDDCEDEDFDIFDFAEIGKDAPREYVAININERVTKKNSK